MKSGNLAFFVPHLGCPYHCSFCDQTCITGNRRMVSADEVIRTAREQAQGPENRAAHTEIAFFGGSFTLIPRPVMTELLAAGAYCVQNLGYKGIRLSTRPDGISPEIIKTLLSFGVTAVELGAQSMEDEVLRKNGRGHTAQDVVDAAGQIRSAGIELGLQMMTGLPGATPDSDLSTARQLAALKPDGVRIYPTVIVRDTALYDLWQAGQYQEHTVEDAVETCARLLPVFEAADIPVIRLGLNPTEELSSGAAVAGAYHPALGELVQSRLMLQEARRVLADVPPHSAVTLAVARGKTSQMTGQHRQNVAALCQEFGLSSLKMKETDLKGREIQIFSLEISGDI